MKALRAYGPHLTSGEPATVLRGVGERGRVQWVLVPVHPAIVRQRRQINTLAHEAGR